MSRPLGLVAGILLFAGTVSAQTSPQYGQCGGIGWTGPTTCPSGWSCNYSNDWYSQCLPGTSGNPPPTTTANPPGTTTSVPGGTATLVPGYSFIRAVEDPNFHKYLQSETINTVGNAVLGDPSAAAQFQITNGQLVQNAGGTPLYAVVQSRTDPTLNKLQVSWSKTPATSGAFSWSGDTVLWSDPTVTRPQNNAFLVCPDSAGNKDLYINLGPYGYMTPAGCADETIHAYTGSTATA